MRALVEEKASCLTVVQLPACALDLNPTEGSWSLLKRGALANLAVADLCRLIRVVKRGLKKIQYRPHLVNGCLAEIGLTLLPSASMPSDITNQSLVIVFPLNKKVPATDVIRRRSAAPVVRFSVMLQRLTTNRSGPWGWNWRSCCHLLLHRRRWQRTCLPHTLSPGRRSTYSCRDPGTLYRRNYRRISAGRQ